MKPTMKLVLFFPILIVVSCGEAFLDVKPNQRQRVPSTVKDYMGLLDNIETMNNHSAHGLGILGSDEYYLSDAQWNSIAPSNRFNYQKNAYLWQEQVYQGGEGGPGNYIDWNRAYWRILVSNMVIEGVRGSDMQSERAKLARGSALFHRAYNFYSLAQLYCPLYVIGKAENEDGLPLRLEVDLTLKTPSSSLEETYRQIISDLKEAEGLLPESPENVFRPSKVAVYAMLARVYLQMGFYNEAESYSSLCLESNPSLIDFNQIEMIEGNQYPFDQQGQRNPEVILITNLGELTLTSESFINIDTTLIEAYEPQDLRKKIYFSQNNGRIFFRGSYGSANSTSRNLYFTGLATDELYLIRAEARIRNDDLRGGLEDLNYLRKHRFVEGSDYKLDMGGSQELLAYLIEERRRELVLRGNRWSDLRRFNQEGLSDQTLKRVINGDVYELPPNDARWVWPLPIEVVPFSDI